MYMYVCSMCVYNKCHINVIFYWFESSCMTITECTLSGYIIVSKVSL